MAEENHPHEEPDVPVASRRERARQMASRAKKSVTRRATAAKTSAPAAKASPRSSARRPLRSLVIFSMVGGLVATVGLPAYGAITLPSDEPQTLQQVAAEDAQSLVIASDAGASEEPVDLGRESYSATTAEEIEEKKAEEAAAEAEKAAPPTPQAALEELLGR